MDNARRKKLEDWLRKDEQESFGSRVERLDFLEREYGKPRSILFFGTTPGMAFDEARLTYLHGLYISCIVITESIIEQAFAGLWFAAGDDDVAEWGYRKIIDKACSEGWIEPKEHDSLVSINKRRNSLVHFRSPSDGRHPIVMAVSEGTDFWSMARSDAERILAIPFRMLDKSPFRGA